MQSFTQTIPSGKGPSGEPGGNAARKQLPLAEYWRCIYYKLGVNELRGLLQFLCLARSLQVVPVEDTVITKYAGDVSLRRYKGR